MSVDDQYTKALLHMNDADASTTFTDESGKTWTARGNAQIDTAQYKFGGASGLLDGTGDSIDTPDNADFAFGTGDFTIDFRIRYNSIADFRGLIAQRQDATNYWLLTWATDNKLYFQNVTGGVYLANYNFSWTPSLNTWYHIAVVRNGTSFYMFLDGVSQTLTVANAIGSNNLTDISGVINIGYDPANNKYHNGWLDEFRVSKGIARWTANFTPPTLEYGVGAGQFINWSNY
jgi:hypothetical protein